MTNDNGSLTFEQVLQKMIVCTRQLVLLEMVDTAAKLTKENSQGEEDYRPLLEILIKEVHNLGGRGTYDQQQ